MAAALDDLGVVGQDLLRVDWQQTPIGPPAAWPTSLRTIVQVMLASRFAMWMAWGPELTFFCNDAYRRDTLGKKYPWALGRPASDVWAEIWPEIGPRIDHVLESGEATWDESLLLFLERNGYEEETYHTFSYSPLTDDAGTVAGMLCVVSEDTDRVIGERRMATLRDLGNVPNAVEDERAFLQACARQLEGNPRSLPFAVIYTFDERRHAHLAAAAGVAAGTPVAPELIAPDGEQIWPARTLADGHADWIVIDNLAQRFGSVPTGAWPAPPLQAVAVPLPSGSGAAPLGFLAVGVNRYRPVDDVYRGWIGLIGQRLGAGIDAARSYAAERRRAEELEELDRAKTNFFSNVSHEFRTPLTLMLAPLEDALQERLVLEHEQVKLVHSNGLRLLKLVGTLLDFSKLDAGRLHPRFRPTDAAGLTAELAGTFRDACERAGLTLQVDCEPILDPVYLDPELWERVVLNLMSNAFKVTLTGGIRVHLRTEHGALMLSVADTGPGIAPEEQQHIFTRFHRVRGVRTRTHEGTGIGLALVQEIVSLHGGSIGVESVPGEGAEFRVAVPLGSAHLAPEHVSEEPATPESGIAELYVQEAVSWLSDTDHSELRVPDEARSPGSNARVLIADDNPALRRYLTRLLSRHWEVEAVEDGLAALESVRRDPPDLVVSDVMMPNLDGFGLLRQLRSTEATRELPVIMLSARAGEEASIEGLEAGADDYLTKPFSGRELVARVRAHLELSLTRRAAAAAIRAERALLEQTLRQLPVGVVVAEAPDDEIVLVNDELGFMLGHPGLRPEEIRSALDGRVYLSDRSTPRGADALTRAFRGESTNDLLLAHHQRDGRWRNLRQSAAPVLNEQGEAVAAVAVLEDVSDRMLNEKLLVGQRDVMAMIAAGEPLEQTLAALARLAEAISQRGALASIMLVSEDRRRLVHGAAPSLPTPFNEAVSGLQIAEGSGSCGTAAHRRRTVIIRDIEQDPMWEHHRELAREHGLRSCWSTPLFAHGGRLIGTFAIYHRAPHEPSSKGLEIVELLARTAAVAIERARDVESRERQLSELQTSLLPPELPTVGYLQAAAAFHSGDRSLDVGGDFYDLYSLQSGAWGMIIGDVCGHGAEAAAVTALARHTAWNHAQLQEEPGLVLTNVSEALRTRGNGRFCTAIHARVEPHAQGVRMSLAVGGHPPPLIRRADASVQIVREHGPLLGVLEAPQFPVVDLLLTPGDTMLLYTDGLVERNPRIAGEAGLARLLSSLTGASAQELLGELETTALGPEPRRPRDDVAILMLRVPDAE